MVLLESLLFALAPAIGKALRKALLGESAVAGLVDPVLDVLFKSGGDKLKQRQQRQQIETIGQQVADELRPFFDSEAASLSQDDRAAVVYALADTLEQARLDASLLIGCGFEPERLAQHLQALRPDATRDLSAAQAALYQRLLHEASRAIVKLAPQLDGFASGVAIETLQDVERIRLIVTELLKQREQAAEQFERAYGAAVAAQFDRVEEFGILRTDVFIPRQLISATYITPQIERRHDEQLDANGQQLLGQPDDVKDSQHFLQFGPVDLLLTQERRLVIIGDPGGGKSTLLQWLAVKAGRQLFDGPLARLNGCVPFFIRLREHADKEFPKLKELPELSARNLPDSPPPDWLRHQFLTGNALLLIDGVDELPRTRRAAMLGQLDQLVREYPLARYVISSRPAALKPDELVKWGAWIAQTGFTQVSLQPLDPIQIEDLIDKWHEALKATALDAVERVELEPLSERLKRELRKRPALRRLATNPLLCVLLCALHRERGAELPAERIKLYEECVEMLLQRPNIKSDADYPQMRYDQKLALLKSFALWLMRRSASDATCKRADKVFEHELPSLDLQTSGDRVRAFFVECCALLQTPVADRIGFAHRPFQEYLAAQAMLDDEDIDELLSRSYDDQWRETIILAAGKARPEECEDLLRRLIDRGNQAKQKQSRRSLQLLAVACLETAVKVSPETRQHVLDQAAILFPPEDMDEARMVASAGDPALSLLKHQIQFTDTQAASCVRALALIGTEGALQILVDYADHADWLVQDEIGRSWDAFDRAEYARQILAHRTSLSLPFFPSVEHVRLLPQVTMLTIHQASEEPAFALLTHVPTSSTPHASRDPRLSDLTPLAELPNLTALTLSGCTHLTSLAPLARLSDLATLTLSGCTHLTSLAPLAELPNLTTLTLSSCPQITSLAPLAQIANLTSLDIRGMNVHELSLLLDLPNLEIIM